MLKKFSPLGLLLIIPLLALSNPAPVIGPDSPLPDGAGGLPLFHWSPTDDYVGEVLQVGTTWYDYQHNGSTSRMIALDSQSNVHVVWMNGMQSGAADRHIFYNFISAGVPAFPSGVQINTLRSGYTTLDLNADDIPVAFYHSTVDSTRSVCAWDAVYGAGAFNQSMMPPPFPDAGLTWPHGVVDAQGFYHAATQTNPNTQIYYSRSEDLGETFSVPLGLIVTGGMAAVSQTMAAAPITPKVALGYTHPLTTSWIDEDVYYYESMDGVTWDWNNPVNLTNFGFAGHPMTNDVRAWSTVNMLYDDSYSEGLHIAYTTILNATTLTGESILWHWSELTGHTKIVGELEFGNVYSFNDPGAWHSCWDVPTMGKDASGVLYVCWEQCTTPGDASAGGFGNFDVYVTYSENNGLTWMAPVNITNTHTPGAPAGQCLSEGWPTLAKNVDDYLHILYIEDRDAGGVVQTEGTWTENAVIYQKVPVADILTDITIELVPLNPPIMIPAGGGAFEYDVTITNNSANEVVFDCYIEIILPSGALHSPILLRNNVVLPGGGSINRTMSQNIPAIAPPGEYVYRVGAGDYGWSEWAFNSFTFEKAADGDQSPVFNDWTCSGWSDGTTAKPAANVPDSPLLLKASPNPFNPVTEIAYTLPADGNIRLAVYDVTGRETAVLHSGYHQAGSYTVTFDAGNLTSGVYFISLTGRSQTQTIKTLLVK